MKLKSFILLMFCMSTVLVLPLKYEYLNSLVFAQNLESDNRIRYEKNIEQKLKYKPTKADKVNKIKKREKLRKEARPTKNKEGKPVKDDEVVTGELGQSIFPDSTNIYPSGESVWQNGTTVYADGTTIYPDGTITNANGEAVEIDQEAK